MFSRLFRSKKKQELVSCCICKSNTHISGSHRIKEWICPSCQQNNRFNEDGGYGQRIPASQDILMQRSRTSLAYAAPGKFTGQPSLTYQPELCQKCRKKQIEKIQRLNLFEPSKKVHYREEYEDYKHLIEEQYKLCRACQQLLQQHLSKQGKEMRTLMLNSHLQQTHKTPSENNKGGRSSHIKMSIGILVLQVLSLSLLSFVLYGEFCKCSMQLKEVTWMHSRRVERLIKRVGDNLNTTITSLWSSWNTSRDTAFYVPMLSEMEAVMGKASQAWTKLLLCLQPHIMKVEPFHIIIANLLLQTINFFKWQTRVGILVLLASVSLLAILAWEVISHTPRLPLLGASLVLLCWILNLFSLTYAVLMYVGFYRRKKRRKTGFHQTPCISSPSSLSSQHLNSSSESSQFLHNDEDDSQVDVTAEKSPGALDRNLNAMSLGSSFDRTNTPPSRPVTPGSYWSPDTGHTSTPNSSRPGARQSPLVAMGQRPLIIPATFNVQHSYSDRRSVDFSTVERQNDINMDSAEEDELESDPRNPHARRTKSSRYWNVLAMLFSLKTLFICSLLFNIILLSLLFRNAYRK